MLGPLMENMIDKGDTVAVATTGTAYTNSVKIDKGAVFAFWYKFYSATDVDVGLNLELSIDNIEFVTADGDSELVECTTKTLHCVNISPDAALYMRIKMIGAGVNSAGTELIFGKLCKMYDI